MSLNLQDNSILKLISTSPLFSNISALDSEKLIKYFNVDHFNQGDVIFTDGSFSKKIYFVSSGSFEIVSFDTKYRNSKQLRVLKAGEHFSELSILTKSKHGTSAFALESGTLLSIEAFNFFNLLKEVPQVTQNLILNLASLIHETIKKSQQFKPLSEATVTKFEKVMSYLVPLNLIDKYKVIPLRLDGMHLVVGMVNPLELDFYLEFKKNNPDFEVRPVLINELQFSNKKEELKKLYAGGAQQSQLNVVIDNSILAPQSMTYNLENMFQVLKQNVLFSKANSENIKKSFPFFEFKKIQAHQDIFSPGKENGNYFIILSGAARLFKRNPVTGGMVPLYKLDNKNIFFDVNLLTNENLKLTARTLVETELCIIPSNIFNQLLKSADFSISFAVSLAETLQKINKFTDGIAVAKSVELKELLKHSSILPKELSLTYKVIVKSCSKSEITVVSPEPTDRNMIEAFAKHMPRYLINFKFITDETYRIWKTQLTEAASKVSFNNISSVSQVDANEGKINFKYKVSDYEPSELFNAIIENAFSQRASNIHIESLSDSVLIRYRVDGSLRQDWEKFSLELGKNLIRHFKSMSNIENSEAIMPQEGKFSHSFSDLDCTVKVTCVFTRYGEKLVLHLINKTDVVVPIRHLSSEKNVINFFKNISRNRHGLFIVAGPASSGKTSTIYSLLNEINDPTLNIVTIEDPIEANLSNINQTEVQNSKGLTAEVLFKNLLMQDPDVIYINEIRDSGTLQLALNANMSGRLVLASFHANNSIDVLPRLKELGQLSTANLASNLLGVVSQKLVRKLCNSCKKPRILNDFDKHRLQFLGKILNSLTEVMDSQGCDKCNHTGYSGQIPLFEYWQSSKDIKTLMLNNAPISQIMEKISISGFESFNEYGLRMVAFGLTTFNEIDRALFGVEYESKLIPQPQIVKTEKKTAV